MFPSVLSWISPSSEKHLIALCLNNPNEDKKIYEFNKNAVRFLIKELRKSPKLVSELEKAISTKCSDGKCVTIPATSERRLLVAHRRCKPQVIYCRLWRWPDLQSHHQIKARCPTTNEPKSSGAICINPYHYERNIRRPIDPVLVPSSRIPPDLSTSFEDSEPLNRGTDARPAELSFIQHLEPFFYQERQPGRAEMIQPVTSEQEFYQQQSQPLQPCPQPQEHQPQHHQEPRQYLQAQYDQQYPQPQAFSHGPPYQIQSEAKVDHTTRPYRFRPKGFAGRVDQEQEPHYTGYMEGPSTSSVPAQSTSYSQAPLISSQQYPTQSMHSGYQMDGGYSVMSVTENPPENQLYSTNTDLQMDQPQVIDMQQVPFTDDKYWCSITYHEYDQRVGEKYHSSSPVVSVDGFTQPMCNDRFCIGGISNVNRNQFTEWVRRRIGRGAKLTYVDGDVYVENVAESSVFVSNPLQLVEQNKSFSDEFVTKLTQGASAQVFSTHEFGKLLHNAVAQGFEAVYKLTSRCVIRMSFVKGWGSNYKRQSIYNTPCWVEVQLNGPLQWIDKVLRQMRPPMGCGSTS